ncbi:hypothetical protein C8R44DRAFT_886100 [Mycena epipterygia]|nr:hypothetical protein C8R44DRAFT_886100 [Mycena epipterygia]
MRAPSSPRPLVFRMLCSGHVHGFPAQVYGAWSLSQRPRPPPPTPITTDAYAYTLLSLPPILLRVPSSSSRLAALLSPPVPCRGFPPRRRAWPPTSTSRAGSGKSDQECEIIDIDVVEDERYNEIPLCSLSLSSSLLPPFPFLFLLPIIAITRGRGRGRITLPPPCPRFDPRSRLRRIRGGTRPRRGCHSPFHAHRRPHPHPPLNRFTIHAPPQTTKQTEMHAPLPGAALALVHLHALLHLFLARPLALVRRTLCAGRAHSGRVGLEGVWNGYAKPTKRGKCLTVADVCVVRFSEPVSVTPTATVDPVSLVPRTPGVQWASCPASPCAPHILLHPQRHQAPQTPAPRSVLHRLHHTALAAPALSKLGVWVLEPCVPYVQQRVLVAFLSSQLAPLLDFDQLALERRLGRGLGAQCWKWGRKWGLEEEADSGGDVPPVLVAFNSNTPDAHE